MEKVTIRASNLRNFGETQGSKFCLITSPDLVDRFSVEAGTNYSGSEIIAYTGEIGFGDFIREQAPERAHILAILPNCYVKSPTPEDLGIQRKLAVMACSSTPTSLEAIAHFLSVAERTDPLVQDQAATNFFSKGEQAQHLAFVDAEYHTSATFDHLSDALSWHEQIGMLDWGQQQLIPAGEISVLPVSVFDQDINTRFNINGELALRGYPVLHSGTPSYLPSDQERIFRALATMQDHAVVARVEKGAITDLSATSPICMPAVKMLQAMFEVDSRYRNLLEIGFGINVDLNIFKGNAAMNEVYGGSNGVVHYGFGLIPYTQYHLDIICPGTIVFDENGEIVFGSPREHINTTQTMKAVL